MKYLLNNSTDPYFNLAFDEYCLENVRSDEPYFYLWRNRPSVIIGLNQNAFSEVNLEFLRSHGITLARRVTGGGAVYHDLQNLNYTIVGKHPSPQPIADALRSLGADAELTGRNDIFVDGRKCSGYARRVSHGQEIIHGTLMYDVDLETLAKALDTPDSKMHAKGIASVKTRVANLKDCLPQLASIDELQSALFGILSRSGDGPMEFPEDGLEAVRKMAEEKFSTWDFIYGSSRDADFVKSGKLPCGTVEAHISLDHGIIRSISFTGDYLFDSPSEDLASALAGTRYDADSLRQALSRIPDFSSCFRGTAPDQLIQILLG